MAEESIGTARIDVVVNTGTMEAGVEAAKRRVSGLGAEAEQQFNKASASTKKYADSLLRQAEMLGKTRAEQIAYNAQLRIGGELGDKIAAKALSQQKAMIATLGATGKSAKELQFAMRGLPAQITDIGVSLASGQRPMMVLLQQGGQLKDMFGGIKPAAKALGGALLGLLNPFTVTAAAAGALLLAWKQGSDEAVAYNKALIDTGNYAGVTASQLAIMAGNIDESTNATQHSAAAALAQVAGTGKFAGEQIELIGRAAIAMSTITGQATAETIKQFEAIGEKPVEAILKLNDAQHFLTQSTYEQIKTLEDQGHTQEAAALAMQTYSDALTDRAKEVVDNAGTMERAWRGITGAAKEAWDAMLGVGRPESDDDKLGRLQREANAAAIAYDKLAKNPPTSTWYSLNLQDKAYYAKWLADAKARSDAAVKAYHDEEHKQEAARKTTADQALQARLTQDRADSDREAAQYFTNAQKRAKEYLAAQQMFAERIKRAKAAGDTALADSEQRQLAAVLAGIDAKYAEKPKAPKRAVDFSLKDRDLVKKQIEEEGKLADQRKRSEETTAAYAASLRDMLDTRQQAINLQVESVGMGQKEIQQKAALIAIDEDYNRKRASLEKQQRSTTSEIDKAGFQQQLDDLAKYHDERVRMELDGAKRADEARSKFVNGAKAALTDFNDKAANVADASYTVLSNAFDGMSDAIARFVTTGKLDFKGLVASILSDLAKMEARILASKILQSLLGAFFGGSSTGDQYVAAGGNGAGDGGYGMMVGTYAKGDVFSNSPSLSAYSGNVYDSPQIFKFASGAGVFGEAGPEAIMPLKRGSDGKLGVVSQGGGGVQLNQTFVIDSNGQSSDKNSGAANSDAMRQFSQRMRDTAKQVIVEEQRQGGSLWRMAHA